MSQPQRTTRPAQQLSSNKPAHELNAEIKAEINKYKVNIDRKIFAKGLVDRDDLKDAKKEYNKSKNTMVVKQCREEILSAVVGNEKSCKFNVSLVVAEI